MWIGIDDAEILIEEDLLFEKERVDLRVSFLGEGATARAKDKVWDDAIISVFFFLNIYICVRVLWYIYVCVKWRFFSPSKEGTIERKTQTRVRFTLSLSPSLFLSGLFRSLCPNLSLFSLVRKKREKKNRIKFLFEKAGIFPRIPPLFVSHNYYYYVELFSLSCAYTLKRGLEKREKTSAYKSNNNNKRERERKNSFDNTQNRSSGKVSSIHKLWRRRRRRRFKLTKIMMVV